mmetsp:Transcript_79462/g.171728  ORF Transcript_79462/g.171728 Transcript_79462/m.171728 type:complete len:234 (-) Transcript_79462:44-745(-)
MRFGLAAEFRAAVAEAWDSIMAYYARDVIEDEESESGEEPEEPAPEGMWRSSAFHVVGGHGLGDLSLVLRLEDGDGEAAAGEDGDASKEVDVTLQPEALRAAPEEEPRDARAEQLDGASSSGRLRSADRDEAAEEAALEEKALDAEIAELEESMFGGGMNEMRRLRYSHQLETKTDATVRAHLVKQRWMTRGTHITRSLRSLQALTDWVGISGSLSGSMSMSALGGGRLAIAA